MRQLLSFLFALPLWVLGQDSQNALLWRISRPEGGPPSYLLGTVHSRDARAYSAITLAQAAMDACGSVYGELDMAAAKNLGTSAMDRVLMPAGQRLSDLYSPGKYKRVQKALQAKVGPMYMMLTHMKPILLSAMLTEETMGKDSALVLDEYLQTRAKEKGKRTGGIETIAEQLAAMDAIPLKDQADMLYATVRAHGQAKEMDRMLDAYARQDLAVIGKLMKTGGMTDAFSRSLLIERNVVMAQRIDSLMDHGPALFAVGAAHLPGTGGVLALLVAQGLQVQPVWETASIGPAFTETGIDPPPVALEDPEDATGDNAVLEEVPPPQEELRRAIASRPRSEGVDWNFLNVDSLGFSAWFPGPVLPITGSSQGEHGIQRRAKYISEAGPDAPVCLIGVGLRLAGGASDEEILTSLIGDIGEENAHRTEIHGFPALRMSGKANDGGEMRSLMVLTGTYQFLLIAQYPADDAAQAVLADEFLGSFVPFGGK